MSFTVPSILLCKNVHFSMLKGCITEATFRGVWTRSRVLPKGGDNFNRTVFASPITEVILRRNLLLRKAFALETLIRKKENISNNVSVSRHG